MQISETTYTSEVLEVHEFEFGTFYYFQNFVLAEISEGINFDWPKAKIILDIANRIYPINFKPHYISNKINSYSIDPTIWLRVFKTKRRINTYVVIDSNPSARFNLLFEKQFFKGKIRKFDTLYEAIYWAEEN